jgi:hypothetical protein
MDRTTYIVYTSNETGGRELVDEPNEFVTFDAACLRSSNVPGSNFLLVSWEEADRLKAERERRLNPPEPEFCPCCCQEML